MDDWIKAGGCERCGGSGGSIVSEEVVRFVEGLEKRGVDVRGGLGLGYEYYRLLKRGKREWTWALVMRVREKWGMPMEGNI